jgi:DNA/RNA endonuclease G (NUC1)
VVMSKSRQLCLFSAVNIDGKNFKKAARKGWLRDPRIKDEQQIFGDVYGNSPRFSRGHMTRREDPIWGSAAEADVGNRDSMHFTNAAPQMQPFNAPVWLALEDYAIKNARRDKMRICVMTGPFFRKDDPVKFGVRIPVEFWKLIIFIHDDTGELTCTGYTMSQEEFLSPLEFVFGEFKEAQVPVALIEKRARLNFHGLAKHDPLAGEEGAYVPLTHVSEVRFV